MSIGSRLTIATVALGSKFFLNTACASVKIHGLDHLLTALDEAGRKDRGIITVANTTGLTTQSHGVRFLPVIETVRGAGVHQPAVDIAVDRLNSGAWYYVRSMCFLKAKLIKVLVSLAASCYDSSGACKWFFFGKLFNVKRTHFRGRMIMSTTKTPVIIPMNISGLEKVMPEPRRFKFLPRPGHHISITFGDPAALTQQVDRLVQEWRSSRPSIRSVETSTNVPPLVRDTVVSELAGDVDTARLSGQVRKQAIDNLGKEIDWTDEEIARVSIVALLQDGVARLALDAHPL
ncbi:hypothetical protein AG1IA_04614 [Rhizoctonia solani AG-1 IA]|uniref:Tafazzin family protein n=1 Tax=Thanatephorus cucumeris (strain AG1-IA) TaxID=983506 RepID=L8WTB8_THACA|nr:hypothetical protein AG1IA_04614 [Rhizoctonia solani AG-1 IA]